MCGAAGGAVAGAAGEPAVAAGRERRALGAAEALHGSGRQHGGFSSGALQTQREREVPYVRRRPGEDRQPAAVAERSARPRGKRPRRAGRRRRCRGEGEERRRKSTETHVPRFIESV